jgi:glycine/D-amino acid oxidase-like deaminating enzyme
MEVRERAGHDQQAAGEFEKEMAMAQRVVVAGGGIVGAAITYYLARAGAQVTLVEREQPGRKTSNNSFAWVNAFSRTTRSYYDFARRSVEMYRQLPDELGIDMELHWHGGLHWVDQPEAAAVLQARVQTLQHWGHAVEMISRDELVAREPHVRPTVAAACYSASDGAAHPPSVIRALLQRAQTLGVEVRTDTSLVGVEVRNGHVTGARLPSGVLAADVVVDAAGSDAAAIGAMVGIQIPMFPKPGTLVLTVPLPPLVRTVMHAPDIHLRQQADGRILLGESWTMDTEDTDLSLARGQHLLARAATFLPELAQAHVETMKIGVRPMPQDERPIVGPVPGISGFYVAVTHSGVTLAPLVGQLVAQEVTTGQPSPLLAEYRLERFGVLAAPSTA